MMRTAEKMRTALPYDAHPQVWRYGHPHIDPIWNVIQRGDELPEGWTYLVQSTQSVVTPETSE